MFFERVSLSLSLYAQEGNLPPLTMFSQTTDAKVSAASPGIILNAAESDEKRFSVKETAAAFIQVNTVEKFLVNFESREISLNNRNLVNSFS